MPAGRRRRAPSTGTRMSLRGMPKARQALRAGNRTMAARGSPLSMVAAQAATTTFGMTARSGVATARRKDQSAGSAQTNRDSRMLNTSGGQAALTFQDGSILGVGCARSKRGKAQTTRMRTEIAPLSARMVCTPLAALPLAPTRAARCGLCGFDCG